MYMSDTTNTSNMFRFIYYSRTHSLNYVCFYSRICIVFAVMNNYQAAAAAAQGFGPPASPHTAATRGGFPNTNSPGPTIDMYGSNAGDSVGYVQAASPQPSGYPAIAVSRAPINYTPVCHMMSQAQYFA